MFGNLNQIVRENIDKNILLKAGIAESSLEAATNEASGVIIDVLKSQIEIGKAKDVLTFFKDKKSSRELIVMMMIKKYANSLNQYYGIDNVDARKLSSTIIPLAIDKFINSIANESKEGNSIIPFLNWLSGNSVNFEKFFTRTNQLKLA